MLTTYRKPLHAQFESAASHIATDKEGQSAALVALSNAIPQTAFHSMWRASTMFWNEALNSQTDVHLSAEEANKKYGIEGRLSFDKPVLEDNAKLMYAREVNKAFKENRFQRLTNEYSYFRKMGTSFAVAMAASLIDPIEAPMSFFPVVGQAGKAAQSSSVAMKVLPKTRTAFANWATKGIIKEESVKALVGGNAKLARFAEGAIEGSVGNAFVEPFILMAATAENNSNYDLSDSFLNIAAGGVLGSFLQGGIGLATRIQNNVKDVPISTRELAFEVGLSDVLNEGKIEAPAKVLMTDDSVIRAELIEEGIDPTPERIKLEQDKRIEQIREEELDKLDYEKHQQELQEEIESINLQQKNELIEKQKEAEVVIQSKIAEEEAEVKTDEVVAKTEGDEAAIDNKVFKHFEKEYDMDRAAYDALDPAIKEPYKDKYRGNTVKKTEAKKKVRKAVLKTKDPVVDPTDPNKLMSLDMLDESVRLDLKRMEAQDIQTADDLKKILADETVSVEEREFAKSILDYNDRKNLEPTAVSDLINCIL